MGYGSRNFVHSSSAANFFNHRLDREAHVGAGVTVGYRIHVETVERITMVGKLLVVATDDSLEVFGVERHRIPLMNEASIRIPCSTPRVLSCRSDLRRVVFLMSYRCEICGKEPWYGKQVSFSHKRSSRRWLPNIQRVRVKDGTNTRRARVCTSCLKAGKVQKA